MKSTIKHIILFIAGVLIVACSVKKDKFINRSYNAVTSKYNILYNGDVALQTGLEELALTYYDNFWETLPIERMPEKEENFLPGESKNPNFERAEEKAVKAIQKHSMDIGGTERNPQMDEAYLLLGKARYYENRFIPALESFNYILYKYPLSDKIYQAKVWREKVNIRIDNNEGAIKNLKQLLETGKIEGQDLADANAMLTQAYLNIEAYDSAITSLKTAKEYTKNKEEFARYSYILGQLYLTEKHSDSAYTAFQDVIDLNRKSPRRYVIHAHIEQAKMFDYEKGDTLAFVEKFNKLIKDRENRPYLDFLHHQLGNFYNEQNKDSIAEVCYNKSLKAMSQDRYLSAQNYKNIAEIYFDKASYKTAGKYYDSTLLRLEERTREFRKIKKKRENLDDVIRYEEIAQSTDSVLVISSLSKPKQISYYESYIEKLKKEDEKKAKLLAEEKEKEENIKANQRVAMANPSSSRPPLNVPSGMNPPTGLDKNSNFYFYNPATVSFGKIEFAKKWGKRQHSLNWRQASLLESTPTTDIASEENTIENILDSLPENPAYTVDFYLEQLPKDQKVLDSLSKERNNAYYQLGLIYKEKFKEYELAANRLEKLLTFNPEERFILPAKYNLVKIYEIINPSKALVYKNEVIQDYPNSRYAEILLNPQSVNEDEDNPEKVYERLYKDLENNKIREVYAEINQKIKDYFGDENLPKFELLRARVLARIEGVDAYKNALNYVALTYPNSSEGKQAEAIIQQDIPKLEALSFSDEDMASWKIIFPKNKNSNSEDLLKKLQKYINDSNRTALKTSTDVYTLSDDFVVLHGFLSKTNTQAALSLLKDYKDYKITDTAYIISTENYRTIQAKKNFDEWLKLQSN